jgi:hypothetical protein
MVLSFTIQSCRECGNSIGFITMAFARWEKRAGEMAAFCRLARLVSAYQRAFSAPSSGLAKKQILA